MPAARAGRATCVGVPANALAWRAIDRFGAATTDLEASMHRTHRVALEQREKIMRANEVSETLQAAETLAVIVGAASRCAFVSQQRIKAMATTLEGLATASAGEAADAKTAHARLSAALEAGRVAVESGRIDPDDAGMLLVELEHELLAEDIGS